MTWQNFVIPRSNELLEIPPRVDWPGLMGSGGSARAEVLQRVRLFSGPPPDRPNLIMAGHQPGFWHPGVWIKSFVLDEMAQVCNAIPLHLQVDSDLPPLLQASFPTADGRDKSLFYTPPGGRPFETLPVPKVAVWEAFLADMRQRIRPSLQPRIDRLAEAQVKARQKLADMEAPHLGLWLDLLRREIEAGTSYQEIPLSHVCATVAFRRFVADVLNDLPRFWEIYNGALEAYRKHHKVRSKANPMPDLRMRGTAREAPFWVLDAQSIRRGVWIEPDGTILAREVPVGRFTGDPASLSGLSIRPRALTLTLFFRRYVCDLFIHGVGGARYDTITDALGQAWLGEALPPYACISLSLPLETMPSSTEPRDVRRRLRDLHWNPQRFGPDGEKRQLIQAIQQAPTGEKRRLTAAIHEVNQKLEASLGPLRQQWEVELSQAEDAAAARAVAEARDYPYFLYDPAEMRSVARRNPRH